VLAHELGHFKLRHVVKRMAGSPWRASLRCGCSAGSCSSRGSITARRAGRVHRDGARSVCNRAAPVHHCAAAARRAHVAPARVRGRPLRAEHASARDLVSALIKLYRDNAATLTPDPLHSVFYDSHPPAVARIARLRAPDRGGRHGQDRCRSRLREVQAVRGRRRAAEGLRDPQPARAARRLEHAGGRIVKTYAFKDHYQAMAFANAVADLPPRGPPPD